MKTFAYDRKAAAEYAKKWAFRRSPAYYDFENVGGDCTNFASQCIFAGAPVMNYKPETGWFYNSVNSRAAAWTGVEYLYNFLINNQGAGPFGEEALPEDLQTGDIVQLGAPTGDFYHSPVVVGVENDVIYVAAHSRDAYYIPLSSYRFFRVRGIHVLGYRK